MNKTKRCTSMLLSYILLNYERNGIKYDISKIIKLKRFKEEKFTKNNISAALKDLKRSLLIYEPERDIIKLQPWVFDLKKNKPIISREIDYIG